MHSRRIWFDLTNVPHVNFLYPICEHYKSNCEFIFTIRDFAETKGLFEKRFGHTATIIGKHEGERKLMKVLGSLIRIYHLNKFLSDFDLKISIGGDASSIVAKMRGKLSVTFDDNEIAPNWRYSKFSDFAFWPKAVPLEVLKKQGFKQYKLFQYNGFKEDMYVADFVPDPTFLDRLPFTNFVVLRPENIQANYVSGSSSIVPELGKILSEKGFNIVFLPRYEQDIIYVQGLKNVYIPQQPLNGLDLCYYSEAVLTGAGTLAREAACLGIPSFSFFAGEELLSVDNKMVKDGKMFYSRNPGEIVSRVIKSRKRLPDTKGSKAVKSQIIEKLTDVINSYGV